jgi:cell division transport system permease protein
MRPIFFLREAVRATRRSGAVSFAALATVLVTMLVLGVFIPIVQATNGAADSVRSRVEVDVYMKTSAGANAEARVRRELLAIPHVKSLQFVSKQAAYEQQSKIDPQAYRLLGANPLPDTFHVLPDSPGNVLAVRNALTPTGPSGQPTTIDPAIQTVSNKKSDTRKILEVTNLVTITAAALTVLLTIASVLLIANTIRLSLYARRREVEVMKLVGATDWFIRWPFVIEGVVVGAAGAALAIVVLGVTKLALLDPLANTWTLIASPRTIGFAFASLDATCR